ncbi:hypothetical protein ACFY3O_12495 [Streptomyces sp. NPDC001046]
MTQVTHAGAHAQFAEPSTRMAAQFSLDQVTPNQAHFLIVAVLSMI